MDSRKLVFIFFPLLIISSLILAISLSRTKSIPQEETPPGCYYQQVQCIQAPCDPLLVCPNPTIINNPLPVLTSTPFPMPNSYQATTGITTQIDPPSQSINFYFVNAWVGKSEIGKVIIFAGALGYGSDPTGGDRESNQGQIEIWTSSDTTEEVFHIANYLSPTATGPLKITGVKNNIVSLVSSNGNQYCFDLFKRNYINSTTTALKSCKVGGCSGELCLNADSPDVASICIYRADFACYKSASCEVQPTGECGWTYDANLRSCLKANNMCPPGENLKDCKLGKCCCPDGAICD